MPAVAPLALAVLPPPLRAYHLLALAPIAPKEARVSKLIRMDHTGHSTVAEWTADDPAAVEAAVRAFREELDRGYLAMVTAGPGHAEQVHELPVNADLVILRLPIAGG